MNYYCDEYACLSVCSHISETTGLNYANFLCVLPVAVDRSSSDGVVIRYVTYFRFCGIYGSLCIPKRRELNTQNHRIDSNRFLLRGLQSGDGRAKSAVYDCLAQCGRTSVSGRRTSHARPAADG